MSHNPQPSAPTALAAVELNSVNIQSSFVRLMMVIMKVLNRECSGPIINGCSIVADPERQSIQRIGDVELGLICRTCVQLTTHGEWHHGFALVCEERVMVDDQRWDI
jgi:hypothetical protein